MSRSSGVSSCPCTSTTCMTVARTTSSSSPEMVRVQLLTLGVSRQSATFLDMTASWGGRSPASRDVTPDLADRRCLEVDALDDAAVDPKARARRVAGAGAREEHDRARDLVGDAEAA